LGGGLIVYTLDSLESNNGTSSSVGSNTTNYIPNSFIRFRDSLINLIPNEYNTGYRARFYNSAIDSLTSMFNSPGIDEHTRAHNMLNSDFDRMFYDIETHLRYLENDFNQLARILGDNNNITIIPGSNGGPVSIRYTGHMEQNIVNELTRRIQY
jgi:hypothetical protein